MSSPLASPEKRGGFLGAERFGEFTNVRLKPPITYVTAFLPVS